jgi:hypothetical protein
MGTISDPVGAFHDSAIQLFGKLPVNNFGKLTYAFSLGKGAGLDSLSNRKNEYYAYVALEDTFSQGDVISNESMKTFGWYQRGKRNFGTLNEEAWFDRVRYGVGMTYDRYPWHGGVEFIRAKGSIFHGIVDTNTNPNVTDWTLQFAPQKSDRADGGSFNIGYDVRPNLTLLFRGDYLTMLPNSSTYKKRFEAATVGFSYRFKGPNRLDVNYAMRNAKASNPMFQPILNNMGNIFSARVTFFFNSKMF